MSSTPLPALDFTLTPDQILSAANKIVEDTKKLYDEIVSRPKEQRTKENTFIAFISPPNFKSNPLVATVKFPSSVSPDPAIREASGKAKTQLAQFRVVCSTRRDIYQVLKEWNEEFGETQLNETEKYVMRNILRDFERNGLTLSPDDQKKLIELKQRDSALCSEYGQNLVEDKTTVFVTDEELEGLPAQFIQNLPKNDQGQRILSLAYPIYFPVVETAQREETRKKLVVAKELKCHDSNLALLNEAIRVRKEYAALLGYKSYSHYILEKRLAKTPETVEKFLNDLEDKVRELARKDYETLLQTKKEYLEERGEPFDGVLNAWDSGFYQQRYTTKHLGVNDETIRVYFPLQRVINQTLEIYQKILSLRFEEVPQGSFPSWHQDVQLFLVYDKTSATENLIGHFYLDLHPREGKYSHAAIFHLVKRAPNQVPVDAMVANLPKPTPTEPSLLSHDDVVTFFHEFGHIMHSLCSEGNYNMTKFSKCPRDFVEAPSQMLENWCWTSSVLSQISSHHLSSEPLPETLIQSLQKTKNLFEPISVCRQIYLSKLDIVIHSETLPTDLQQLVDELRPKLTFIQNPPNGNILTTFGHIMSQYMSAYYGYLYSKVMSADMFSSRFETEGVLNPETGLSYRLKILAPGGFRDANDGLAEFIGRAPTVESYLKSLGIH